MGTFLIDRKTAGKTKHGEVAQENGSLRRESAGVATPARLIRVSRAVVMHCVGSRFLELKC